jgi:pyruvate formate lyase activating enzyme
MSEALIFSIEEFSVFDGPGIRTTVFLKGCPLRCEWCHNPEGQSFENAIVRSTNGCIGCGECLRRAERVDGCVRFTEDGIANCPQNLLRYSAKEYTGEELTALLSKNFAILNASGGGITFSGGEPLANAEFLLECLDLTEGRVNRAVQTSGFASQEVFERVLDRCDYMLFDLKLADGDMHKRYTGVSNQKILSNFATLAKSGKNFVVRMPMIPTVTDTEENIRGICEILLKNGVKYVELLPYNKLAGAKYSLVDREYMPSFDACAESNMRFDIFAEYGIKAVKM